MVHFATKLSRKLLAGLAGSRFLRDQSAAIAVEFALLALPFFAIIGAILETSLVFLSIQVLDSAVGDATRQIRTGQAQAAGFDVTRFEQLVCDKLYGLFGDCSGLYTSVTTISDFSAVNVTPPVVSSCTNACTWTQPEQYSPGLGSSTVLVQVYYKWPIMLSIGGFDLADLSDHTRLLAAVRVFRNEPF
ncbi:TadE/TadG family type IV pilus assembly protein [Devosia sp.]|uniref:TadE/TadG family type IV pilus assembly protein n=1 Tax=Devosia sp. TaxID=1871048 RepID=UPI003262DB82